MISNTNTEALQIVSFYPLPDETLPDPGSPDWNLPKLAGAGHTYHPSFDSSKQANGSIGPT
jgi:hypothetical protein